MYNHPTHAQSAVSYGCHEKFVIQSADGATNGCEHKKIDPFVMFEIDALFLSTSAEHEERDDGEEHTGPLPCVKLFAKHEHGTYEHHDGSRGVYRSYDGYG